MPRLCEFYGIVIAMFHDDHDPPHFHAAYGGRRALVAFVPPRIIAGELPRRAEALVLEWAQLHADELAEAWQRAREHRPLPRITPLE